VQFAPAVRVASVGETQHGVLHCRGEKHCHARSAGLQPVKVHDCVPPKHAVGGIGSPHGNVVVWNLHEGGPESEVPGGVASPTEDASPEEASGGTHFAVPWTTLQDSPWLHVPFAKHGPLSSPCVAVVPGGAVAGSSPTHAANTIEPTATTPMGTKKR
jgi:hypothetical protein